MSLISVTNLTFAYDNSYENIFSDVSFQLDTNWKLGFCGRNGRGKTTFLKLLMGQFEYQGNIAASVNFEYFPYPFIDASQTAIGVVASVTPGAPQWQIERELFRLEVREDVLHRSFATLSEGEKTKVLLAALLLRDNSFLLIDEPTNHLDMAGRDTVARYLNGKKGYILVSHDRHFLDGCVDHILSINRSNIEIQSGNFSSWQRNKLLQDEYEMSENERLKRDISRMETASRRTAAWSEKAESKKVGIDPAKVDVKFGYAPKQAAKAKKLNARSKAIKNRQQRSIEDKSKLLHNIEISQPLKLSPLTYHSSRLLTVDNLSVTYGDNRVFSDMNFSLYQGDRLSIAGGNGCGKSSLLKLICGEDITHSGTVRAASNLVISYLPQDESTLAGSLDGYARGYKIDKTRFMTILRKLDFSRAQLEMNIRDYSAGQKKKVLIARSLCENAHLYLWDEPLNYIDVFSRIQIEELILTFNPTLLFVEHDRAFCETIATRTITFTGR